MTAFGSPTPTPSTSPAWCWSARSTADIVSAINVHGPLAVGLSGEDARLITASRAGRGLGYVGDVVEVDPTIVERLLAEGLIPVVATIGADARARRTTSTPTRWPGRWPPPWGPRS